MTDPEPSPTLPDWPLSERPGYLIRRLHQIHVALFGEACAPFDVTPVQYSLLSALARTGGIDQTRLAAEIALDRVTAAGALTRLEARGLVDRAVSASDRRAKRCRLTPDGEILLARMEASARLAHRRTIEALDPADRGRLLDMMKRLVAAHEAEPSGPSATASRATSSPTREP